MIFYNFMPNGLIAFVTNRLIALQDKRFMQANNSLSFLICINCEYQNCQLFDDSSTRLSRRSSNADEIDVKHSLSLFIFT